MSALSEGANETEIRELRYNINSHITHLQKTGVTGVVCGRSVVCEVVWCVRSVVCGVVWNVGECSV